MINLALFIGQILFLIALYFFLGLVVRAVYKDLGADDSRVVSARLTVLTGEGLERGHVFPLNEEAYIGRSEENDIVLPDTFLSSQHARIYRKRGSYLVEDLGSTNGTFVDGERVDKPVGLRPGSRLKIGETILQLTE